MNYDVIIVGAGAAGLMCAIEAGKRAKSVLLIDKARSVGEKIRISGGGRCNFTNIHTTPANYLSHNPHFCVSALKRYPPREFIRLVEKHAIAYHEKTLGQLFCDGSAKQIIAMLQAECDDAGVKILLNTTVNNIQKNESGFTLALSNGANMNATSLVIATGGPSIPKMGASGWGYEVAEQFGLSMIKPLAALVPFTLDESILEGVRELAGVALDARVSCHIKSPQSKSPQSKSTQAKSSQEEKISQLKKSFREGMLFTHRGLSGPSILQISSYWQDAFEHDNPQPIYVDFLPDGNIANFLKDARQSNPKQDLHTALSNLFPKRLARYLCDQHNFYGRLADCSNARFEEVANKLHAFTISPNGTEGFRTAEVTLGGVNVDEISSTTFEAKTVKGLYFIGEVVDVTGHLGGFNFQWAWASGHAAGRYV